MHVCTLNLQMTPLLPMSYYHHPSYTSVLCTISVPCQIPHPHPIKTNSNSSQQLHTPNTDYHYCAHRPSFAHHPQLQAYSIPSPSKTFVCTVSPPSTTVFTMFFDINIHISVFDQGFVTCCKRCPMAAIWCWQGSWGVYKADVG